MNPQEFPNYYKILPKWRSFAKSGHTDSALELFKNFILNFNDALDHFVGAMILAK